MIVRKIVAACLCLAALPVLAASTLPPKMAGKQQTNDGSSGVVEATLVQTQGAEMAKLKVSFKGDCTRSGETTAEFKDGVWQFVIPGKAKCEEVSVQVRPVDGKNRLEGEFKSAKKGGTIYFEWQ